MILSALGTAILAVLGFWLLGGFLARAGGALLVLVGAVGLAATGDANGALVLLAGAALWWFGHLHHALRHDVWKSALAGDVFALLEAAWRRVRQGDDGPPPPSGDLRALPGGASTSGDCEAGGE